MKEEEGEGRGGREGREDMREEEGEGRGRREGREGRKEEEEGGQGGGGRGGRGDQSITNHLFSLLQVVGVVKVFNASLQGKLLLLEIPRFGVQVVSVGPVIVKMVTNSLVDG